MRATADQLLREKVYAFVYGPTGAGKTRLIMSLSDDPKGKDMGFITAEATGTTSLASAGYTKTPVEVIDPGSDWESVVELTVKTINEFAKDPNIKGICLDGLTALCGLAVDSLSDGGGEKQLGWDGWAQVLNGFRRMERSLDIASMKYHKTCVMTAWEKSATYEDTMAGRVIKEGHRPLLQGQAKDWLPGKVDIIARMSSKTTKKAVGKEVKREWNGFLYCYGTDEYLAKTRWTLPDPAPADLKKILGIVRGQRDSIVKARKEK